jgi:hypothetical protein
MILGLRTHTPSGAALLPPILVTALRPHNSMGKARPKSRRGMCHHTEGRYWWHGQELALEMAEMLPKPESAFSTERGGARLGQSIRCEQAGKHWSLQSRVMFLTRLNSHALRAQEAELPTPSNLLFPIMFFPFHCPSVLFIQSLYKKSESLWQSVCHVHSGPYSGSAFVSATG